MEFGRKKDYDINKIYNEGIETEEEYISIKRKLRNLVRRKKKLTFIFGLFSTIGCFGYVLSNTEADAAPISVSILASLICGVIAGPFFGFLFHFSLSVFDYQLRVKVDEYELRHLHEEVQNDIFENSIKMSYKYLDQYYLQIRDQAQKGFIVTVCVYIFGAILIGIGIVLMFMNITNPSYITCASGVITEFIATIFFYMYNKTVTSMSKYHNKLVLSHNISIALKVADTLSSEDKARSKNLIISELLKDMNSYLIRSDAEYIKK